eukprot:8615619-Pyramimonas_sp.AAC.1
MQYGPTSQCKIALAPQAPHRPRPSSGCLRVANEVVHISKKRQRDCKIREHSGHGKRRTGMSFASMPGLCPGRPGPNVCFACVTPPIPPPPPPHPPIPHPMLLSITSLTLTPWADSTSLG